MGKTTSTKQKQTKKGQKVLEKAKNNEKKSNKFNDKQIIKIHEILFKEYIVFCTNKDLFDKHDIEAIIQCINDNDQKLDLSNDQLRAAYENFMEQDWLKSRIVDLIEDQIPDKERDQITHYMTITYPAIMFVTGVMIKFYLEQDVIMLCIVKYNQFDDVNDVLQTTKDTLYELYYQWFPIEKYNIRHTIGNFLHGNKLNSLLHKLFSDDNITEINKKIVEWNKCETDAERIELIQQFYKIFKSDHASKFAKMQQNIDDYVERNGINGFNDNFKFQNQIVLSKDWTVYTPPKIIASVQRNEQVQKDQATRDAKKAEKDAQKKAGQKAKKNTTQKHTKDAGKQQLKAKSNKKKRIQPRYTINDSYQQQTVQQQLQKQFSQPQNQVFGDINYLNNIMPNGVVELNQLDFNRNQQNSNRQCQQQSSTDAQSYISSSQLSNSNSQSYLIDW